MDVFCCCGRRQPGKGHQTVATDTNSDMPSPPPPAILPASSTLLQPPAPEPVPTISPNQSKSSLPLATPIPGAPLEPVEISELVIDDSDSGADSPRPRKSRASSTLNFVKSHLRKHMSQDSLRRQSRNTVGSSTEELARRAELRRLMRKRIQEELQTDESREFDSDGPSIIARFSMTPQMDQLPGGGPRDNLEFSVVEAVEDVRNKNTPPQSDTVPSSPDRTDNEPRKNPSEGIFADPRRTSCPDHMSIGECKHTSRPSSRVALREKRNSLPQQSSGSGSTPLTGPTATGSSLGSIRASSSSGKHKDSPNTGRQAVAALVVAGGFSPKEFTKPRVVDFDGKRSQRSPHGSARVRISQAASTKSRSRSPRAKGDLSENGDTDQSPMKTWLRSQEICSFPVLVSDSEQVFGSRFDGPSAPATAREEAGGKDHSSLLECQKGASRNSSLMKSSLDHIKPLQPQVASDVGHQETVLRGGALGDADLTQSEISDYWMRRSSGTASANEENAPRLNILFGKVSGSNSTSSRNTKAQFQPSWSTSNMEDAAKGLGFATRFLQPFVSREPSASGASSYVTAQNGSSALSLPLPGAHGTQNDASSAIISEASSYDRREEELLTIPKRFGESHARPRANLHAVSRFKEEFRNIEPKPVTPKPSLLSRLHLTIPRRAKVSSRIVHDDDGVYNGGPSTSNSNYSSTRSIPSSRESLPRKDSILQWTMDGHDTTQDAWRRAFRTEAKERHSLARSGSSNPSFRRSIRSQSPRIETKYEHNDSIQLESNRHPRNRRASCSGFSAARNSVSRQQYEDDGFRKELERSNKMLEDWSRGQVQTSSPSQSRGSPVSPEKAHGHPSSWARFPSHTRNERNGSAGIESNVISRDFAVKEGSVHSKTEWHTDRDSATTTSSRRAVRASRVISGKLGKFVKAGLSKLVPSRDAKSSERKIDSHRNSVRCSKGSADLEYPELGLQPNRESFKELKAIEAEIQSLKSSVHPQHSREPSTGTRAGEFIEANPSACSDPAVTRHKNAIVGGNKDGSSGSTVEKPSPNRGKLTAKVDQDDLTTPATPSGIRSMTCTKDHKAPSPEPSEVFVTPASQLSVRMDDQIMEEDGAREFSKKATP